MTTDGNDRTPDGSRQVTDGNGRMPDGSDQKADEDETTAVRDIALVRAGDKGNTSNVAVVADTESDYERLAATLTADRVHERFEHLGAEGVTRYEIPSVTALNFVVEGVLAGGVTTSLRVDSHGKSLSYLVAGMGVPEDDR